MNHKPEDVRAADEYSYYKDRQQAFLAGCEHKQKEMQWISVEERLPEYGELVIVLFGNKTVGALALYTENMSAMSKNYWDHYRGRGSYTTFELVTHWMPLPEPPNTNPKT